MADEEATPTEIVAPAAQPEAPAPSTDEPKPDETGAPAEEPPKEKPKSETPEAVQKRFDELTRKRRDAERDAEYWKSKALSAPATEKPAEATKPLARPDPTAFKNYDDYVEALTDWKVEAKKQEIEQTQKQSVEVEKFNAGITKAREKYQDFDQVALSPSIRITTVMSEAIRGSDLGPDIAYYLGSNPNEASRISSLSPIAAIREIGKIESRLSEKPEPRRISQAPKPVTTVLGSGTPGEVDPGEMSIEEYAKFRKSGGGK